MWRVVEFAFTSSVGGVSGACSGTAGPLISSQHDPDCAHHPGGSLAVFKFGASRLEVQGSSPLMGLARVSVTSSQSQPTIRWCRLLVDGDCWEGRRMFSPSTYVCRSLASQLMRVFQTSGGCQLEVGVEEWSSLTRYLILWESELAPPIELLKPRCCPALLIRDGVTLAILQRERWQGRCGHVRDGAEATQAPNCELTHTGSGSNSISGARDEEPLSEWVEEAHTLPRRWPAGDEPWEAADGLDGANPL